MLAQLDPLPFVTAFDAQPGRVMQIKPGIARLTAPNAGPFTFTGTNTYLVGTERLFVVDPGPDLPAHFEALLAAIDNRDIEAILLTHTHKDHSRLAPRLAEATGAPIWFGGPHRLSRPRHFLEINPISASCDWKLTPDRNLQDAETLDLGTCKLLVIATPGHCANHLAYAMEGTDTVLTGDHVMGWNSTLVAPPDGAMDAYLTSLQKLMSHPGTCYLPAHGGPIADGPAFAAALLQHRLARNDQILSLLASGPKSLSQMQKVIYPGLPPANGFAARLTLGAHLEYLLAAKSIARIPGITGWRYRLAG